MKKKRTKKGFFKKHRKLTLFILAPLAIILAYLIYFAAGAVIPNAFHRSVDSETAAAAETAEYTADTVCGEEVRYISDNDEAMELRLAMIESAQSSIILSTFDFNPDRSGRELMSSLLNAAERGVDVKIIVDGISGFLDLRGNSWFKALASSPQVEIKIYNPVNLLIPWQNMYRLHDKYVIIDEDMYLLGGRNSTNLFLGDYSDHENIDSEVFVRRTTAAEGDSLNQVLDYFQRVWALDESRMYKGASGSAGTEYKDKLHEIYDSLSETYPAAFEDDYLDSVETVSANKITLLSNPIEAENKAPELWESLMGLIKDCDDVYAVTPYVILSDEMTDDLAEAGEATESFTMIINDVANGANPWGCVDYINRKDSILATGITVAEYSSSYSLHTKNLLLDDRLTVVGSFNFDMRSAYLDTELMLVIDSAELNDCLWENISEKLSSSRLVSLDGEEAGENFHEQSMSSGKSFTYSLLRYLMRPFRCLM